MSDTSVGKVLQEEQRELKQDIGNVGDGWQPLIVLPLQNQVL